jgi:dihydrofolate synthase / folylpolyglutamate synthase
MGQDVEVTSDAVVFVESLSPWPKEFGVDRMRELLAALADPQRAFRSIHVVGTNGKSTATRTVEEHLAAEGLRVGAYLSPHVRGWSERIRVGGEEADFDAAVARVRPAAERLGATQFEVLTAAALAAFADAEVDAAVVEAGLGGRHDATNVLDPPVVLLTNVALDHTDVLGGTRAAIAEEKLAVVRPGATAVLPDREYAHLVPHARVVIGGAREAAEAFLGRPLETSIDVALPGRLEVRGEAPYELWDGAHNPAAATWLTSRLPERDFVLVASILADKDAEEMLTTLQPHAKRVIATTSSNARAWSAERLAAIARGLGPDHRFASVEEVEDPREALERARRLAGPDGAVLVTGSLYLLADLANREGQRVE